MVAKGKSIDQFVAGIEYLLKKPSFNCNMCGQCILHDTGLTCPKNLRNGPCGGVRRNGHCEVNPDMKCVWLKAFYRADKLHRLEQLNTVKPPVNNLLKGTSAWINWLTKRDKKTPKGWANIGHAIE